MNLSLSSDKLSVREMMLLFRDRIRDQLSTVEGVAEIRAYGYQEPLLRVDLIADKLRQYDLTATDITDSIRRGHDELPAGKFESGDEEDLIRIMGEVSTVEQFQNIVISRRGGSPNYLPLRLKDVASVYEGVENTTRISRVNGVPSLTMAVQKQRGVNAVAIADAIIERVAEINSSLPDGTSLSLTFDRTQFVRESVHELLFTLVLSAILTSIVCWLFIGSWSVTTNILLAIPVAIIGTFLFISWLGFTLNTFSILGLALAIGIVVDDAIVMLENIIRYMQNGYDRVNAAFKGAREISFAVIATSVALISLFIPITFMEGIEGRFFFEFAATLSIAVALSSLESLTLAPMRCSQFLTVSPRTTWLGRSFEAAMDRLRGYYEKTLRWALNHRILLTLFSFVVFVASLFLLRVVPTEFAPDQDRGALFLVFAAPDGKSMKYTDEKVKQFEALATAHPAIDRIMVAVGGFGAGGQGNRGNGVIVLKEKARRTQSSFEVATQLRQEARKSIKGMQIFVRDRFGSSIGGRRGSPIEFTVNGPDPAQQKILLQELFKRIESDPTIVDARSDDLGTVPEVHVVPDRDQALTRGVEIEEIAGVINTALGGVTVGQYTQGSNRFNIFVQLREKDRQSRDDITHLLVRNNRGQPVPMSLVVQANPTQGPQTIFREDRVRGLRVDASLAEGANLGPVTKTNYGVV
ncbi:MAG: efflux RND transporter permease subunit [Bdellovibrionales bacterium]|nr:efflux RND transporter permease subunit [Bdellovibrionales bacterium]